VPVGSKLIAFRGSELGLKSSSSMGCSAGKERYAPAEVAVPAPLTLDLPNFSSSSCSRSLSSVEVDMEIVDQTLKSESFEESDAEARGCPTVGDLVLIIQENEPYRYHRGRIGTKGMVGRIVRDDRSETPYKIALPSGMLRWYCAAWVQLAKAQATKCNRSLSYPFIAENCPLSKDDGFDLSWMVGKMSVEPVLTNGLDDASTVAESEASFSRDVVADLQEITSL
jgi:hypothetical protein